ncbi:type VI secretion system Vgr family protein [Hymenobacter cellulosivorans]|uniref:Type VI secretion system Vgr family protein n=1 Tax=Hymenobacter cellulosivorans TaxID=2932249 RepID=A0ABY4FGM7_9BACT|nr:type VI secretion system Vgr family protein [Hymenobacter cellulosivorans]UOQ55565.1 type VI secretion system Vgr family protein [Hymenobacter cellulosivorans]
MSYPVNVSVHVDGGLALTDYNRLTLSQHVLTHHTFALDFSFEALGKALGLKPDALFAQAHERLSGKNIAISWTGGLPNDSGRSFQFKGIITHISIQTDADLVNYYHVSGYSPSFLLEDGTQSRTFVKKSIQDIFSAVLGAYDGNALKKQLKAQHQDVLPYTVQYHETNFNFLSRLAAQQGEWFYYDGETLQLGRGTGKTIAFKSSSAQMFTLSMHLQPGKTEGAHYNYRTHEPLKTKAATPAGGHPFSQFAVQKSDDLFTQPHRLLAGTQVNDQAQLQRSLDNLAAKRAGNQVSLEGSGEAYDITPGCVLSVQDAMGQDYGKFRVLSVRHEVDGDGNYQNHFEGMPDAAQAPPPNPLYAASDAQPEMAEVIDLQDPRNLGRIRVRYYWPVASPTDAESAWLRVSTPYSGDGKGQLFTPELGSQVLVGYEHGLAEFPVVLGNVFHPQNKQSAKYTNPQNNLKGLQTAGGNKFVMTDTKGEQKILISNSNNKGTAVEVGFKGDGSITIKSSGPVTVLGSTITLEAGDKGEIMMHAKNITMEAEEEIKVTSATKSIALKAEKDITADATLKMAFSAKEKTVSTTGKMEISSGSTVDISGSTVKING